VAAKGPERPSAVVTPRRLSSSAALRCESAQHIAKSLCRSQPAIIDRAGKLYPPAVAYPPTDPFLLHIYAALAEEERTLISKRTKDALTAAKARRVLRFRMQQCCVRILVGAFPSTWCLLCLWCLSCRASVLVC
jgi:hypothetical protein